VGSDVLLQVGELGELPLADLAAVGLDAQVDPGVLGQVGTVREGFIATGALVGLRLPHVDLGVQLQVGFTRKNLKKKNNRCRQLLLYSTLYIMSYNSMYFIRKVISKINVFYIPLTPDQPCLPHP
jgi:hypothetical protein